MSESFGRCAWAAWIGPERDGDGQSSTIHVAPTDGAHVTEADAEVVRSLLRNWRAASPAALDVLRDLRAMYKKANEEYEVGIGLREIREFIERWEARLTAEQEEPRATEAERLLLQLVQAIDKYSNDRFMEWPEYRAATSLLGVKE